MNTQRHHPVAVATLLMTLAALLFAVMALFAKGATVRLAGTEVAFVRFVVGVAACGLATLKVRMRPRNWRGLFWRGVFGGLAVLLYFLGIEHLSVGMATLLNYTAPVFAAIWAWIFLGERIGRNNFAALGITSFGVLLVIVGSAAPGTLGFGRWQLVGLLSAVLSGAAVATIREARKTDGAWEIFTAFCVAGLLCTALPAAQRWQAPTAWEWAMMLGVGLTSVVSQLLMTQALRDLPASVGGVLFQLTPVATMVGGLLLYHEQPSGLAMFGASVTLAGVTWGAWLASAPARARQVVPEQP